CEGRTPKSSAICGSSPAIKNSVVHIKNAPSASTGTIGGNVLLGVRTTVPMSLECPRVCIVSNTAFVSLIEIIYGPPAADGLSSRRSRPVVLAAGRADVVDAAVGL